VDTFAFHTQFFGQLIEEPGQECASIGDVEDERHRVIKEQAGFIAWIAHDSLRVDGSPSSAGTQDIFVVQVATTISTRKILS
jgi:hypothetical protein